MMQRGRGGRYNNGDERRPYRRPYGNNDEEKQDNKHGKEEID
jgi:hypothetical protein